MSEKWRSGYENLLMIDGEQCQTFELLTKMYYKLYSFKFVSCTNSNQKMFFFKIWICAYIKFIDLFFSQDVKAYDCKDFENGTILPV